MSQLQCGYQIQVCSIFIMISGINLVYLPTLIRHESHVCGFKTSVSGQFLTPDWKMWVVAVLLYTISKNMLTQTHVKNENHV